MRLTAVISAFLILACTPSFGKAQARPSPAPSSSVPAAGTLDAFVPIAEAFVEQHRGLKFKAPVKVTFLADTEFQQELAKANGSDATGYVTEAKVLHALGLLDGLPDLARAEQDLQDTSVIGFYDPKTKQLFVRGVDAKPSVRHVLVHELTHALQDQWFSIDRTLSNEDESRACLPDPGRGRRGQGRERVHRHAEPARQKADPGRQRRRGTPTAGRARHPARA